MEKTVLRVDLLLVFTLFFLLFFSGCDCEGCDIVVKDLLIKNNSSKVVTIVLLKEAGVAVEELVLEPEETILVVSESDLDYHHYGSNFYEVYLEEEFAYGCDNRPSSLVSGTFPDGKEIKTEKRKKDFHVITVSLFIWCGDELCEDQCYNQYNEPRKYGDHGDACPDDNKFCHSHAGMDWSQASSYYMEREDAEAYCKDVGGRLPTISELRTLIQNCPQTEYPQPEGQEPWCDAVENENNEIVVSDTYICDSGCEGNLNVFGYTCVFFSSTTDSSYTHTLNWGIHFEKGAVIKVYGGTHRVICVKKQEEDL